MNREEFRMSLEELILHARPDIKLGEFEYTIKRMEEELFGKRGENDKPIKDVEGYAGWVSG